MPREISSEAQAKAEETYSVTPVLIVEIEWTPGMFKYYSTSALGNGDGDSPANASGLITQISDFSDQVNVGASGAFNSIQVAIHGVKSYLDSSLLANISITVYQGYVEYDASINTNVLSTYVRVFSGVMSAPIQWDIATDTTSFEIVTPILEGEYGMSLRKDRVGNYSFSVNDDAWNVGLNKVFGKCLDVPALQVLDSQVGTTEDPINKYITAVKITNGENFPQATPIRLAAGGMVFIGTFNDTSLTITDYNLPRYTSVSVAARPAGDDDVDNTRVVWLTGDYALTDMWLYDSGIGEHNQVYRSESNGTTTKCWCRKFWQTEPTSIAEVAAMPRVEWTGVNTEAYYDYTIETGSTVIRVETNGDVLDDSKFKYICATDACSVLSVKAERTINGKSVLVDVPSRYLTIVENDTTMITGETLTTITLDYPLSSITGEDWADELYVSLEGLSSNTIDCVDHLITGYSNLVLDAATKADVRAAVANYPSNFVISSEGTTLQLVEDILWQARCSMYRKNGIGYLRYLSTEPATLQDILAEDIEVKTMKLSYTDDTQIATRYVALWQSTYGPESKVNRMTFDENQDIYGTRTNEVTFTIYNIESLVEKSASFWAHRAANIWKTAYLSTFLDCMNLESTDAAHLDTDGILSDEGITTIVDQVTINNSNGVVQLSMWMPVIAGSMTLDSGAWVDDSGDTLVDIDVSGLSVRDYIIAQPYVAPDFDMTEIPDQTQRGDALQYGQIVLMTAISDTNFTTKTIESEPSANANAPTWESDVKYKNDDIVSYSTSVYRANKDHESEPGDTPPGSDDWDAVDDVSVSIVAHDGQCMTSSINAGDDFLAAYDGSSWRCLQTFASIDVMGNVLIPATVNNKTAAATGEIAVNLVGIDDYCEEYVIDTTKCVAGAWYTYGTAVYRCLAPCVATVALLSDDRYMTEICTNKAATAIKTYGNGDTGLDAAGLVNTNDCYPMIDINNTIQVKYSTARNELYIDGLASYNKMAQIFEVSVISTDHTMDTVNVVFFEMKNDSGTAMTGDLDIPEGATIDQYDQFVGGIYYAERVDSMVQMKPVGGAASEPSTIEETLFFMEVIEGLSYDEITAGGETNVGVQEYVLRLADASYPTWAYNATTDYGYGIKLLGSDNLLYQCGVEATSGQVDPISCDQEDPTPIWILQVIEETAQVQGVGVVSDFRKFIPWFEEGETVLVRKDSVGNYFFVSTLFNTGEFGQRSMGWDEEDQRAKAVIGDQRRY